MSRVILLILLVLGAIWWVARRRQPPPVDKPAPVEPPAVKPAAQAMLRCAHCGLHLPQDDALTDVQGLAYCCEAHRRLGPAGQSS